MSDIFKKRQINQLKKYFTQQQSLFRGVALQLDTAVGASYIASEILVVKMKSFSDGEIKEYLSTNTAFPV
jgi:predicted house-cleaning NTP pyrophosphatase (Maf/HAM1 superfamily)